MTARLYISTIALLLTSMTMQGKGIEAVVSHATFYKTGTDSALQPYVEAYWQINPRSLSYKRATDGIISTSLVTSVVFVNENGQELRKDVYLLQTAPKTNAEEVAAQNITDLRTYDLPAGKIHMHLTLANTADSTNTYSYTDTFTIFPPVGPWYSSVQFLDTFYTHTANTPFLKNGRQQIPLCTNFYDETRNVLHYYIELYNTNKLSKEDFPLTQSVFISKRAQDGAYERFFKQDTIAAPGAVLPYSGDFNIGTLGSSNCYLNVHLLNSQKKVITTRALFFQRFKPKPDALPSDTITHTATKSVAALENVTVLDLNKTFIAKYTLPQVLAILKMLLPISDASETQTINGFLKAPDETYTRYYIYNYFAGRNQKDPEKAWKDYTTTVKEVNKLFGSKYKPGYETARGIIYLRYGKPSERVTVENEQGSYPYEIWQYNALTVPGTGKSQSNSLFLFYRPQEMLDDYRLLHSTVPGEIRTMNWRGYLYTNGASSSSGNPRAEQYIGNR